VLLEELECGVEPQAVVAGLARVEVAALRAMVHGLAVEDRPLAHVAEAGVLAVLHADELGVDLPRLPQLERVLVAAAGVGFAEPALDVLAVVVHVVDDSLVPLMQLELAILLPCADLRREEMQCEEMQCEEMQCEEMQCEEMQCEEMQCERCEEMQCEAMQCEEMQCEEVQCQDMQ